MQQSPCNPDTVGRGRRAEPKLPAYLLAQRPNKCAMASQIGKTFCDFIMSERDRYEADDNNKVAFSLMQISRYLRFVDIIYTRYAQINESCVAAIRRRMEEDKQQQSGRRTLTSEESDQHRQEAEFVELLHLEVESVFIFVKIALDKIAHFVGDYFGVARGVSQRSHDKWCKSAKNFEREKDIQLPYQLLSSMEWLQRHVADHRDKQITHQENPRTVFGTSFGGDGATRIVSSYLYPRDSDAHTKSPRVNEVVAHLDAYINQLMDLVACNRAKSRYKLRSS